MSFSVVYGKLFELDILHDRVVMQIILDNLGPHRFYVFHEYVHDNTTRCTVGVL